MEYRKTPHVGQSDPRDTWNGKGQKKRQRRRVKEPPPEHPRRNRNHRNTHDHVALMGIHEYTENILAAIGVAVTGTATSAASLWLWVRIIKGLWSKDLGRKHAEASE